MIPIRQFDTLLQTQSLNNKLFQTLVQGSEDTAIKATIQQDGKNIQIETGADIELSILYNGGTTQTYHTDKAKSDFPATIESDGTLIIKFNEMMTTVFGTHKLFLKIVDTNTSYALAMDYTVIKNEAYNPQSTPNNLPAYNTLVAELPKKLNKDFSNADDVALKNKLSTLGIGADETPEQIRDKLQTLKADARLDSSAVKDCLTTDLADVDLDKLDEKFQATDSGKILQQNSQAIGTKANADLSNVSNEDLDSLLVQTDMGKQILDNTKQVQTKLDTDMGNVNTLLFSREMKLTGAYQDLANRPSGQGRTAEQIKALFEANRFEEQAAVDFSDPQFSSTTLYMAYQFTTNNQTITQELPSVADGQIIMVEALLSSGITNPTLTFTAKAGDNIQGSSTPFSISGKSGYLGYFIPLQNENAWQFIPHEISHEFSLAVSDDKSNVHIGINSIEFEKATVTEDGGILKVTPDASTGGGAITFTEIDGKTFTSDKITSMDKSVNIHNFNGAADLSVQIAGGLDGVFAKLLYPEPLNTDFHNQRPYFGDRYENYGTYLDYDMQDKSFTVQDGLIGDDPNISGGSNFRCGFFIEFEGEEVASEDGYVELKAVDTTTGDYLLDDDGNPIAVRHDYKAGSILKREILVASFKAKGQQKIAFEPDVSFGRQILTLSDNSCVYIQAVNKKYNTGMAELIFQQHTGYDIEVHHKYYGINFMNFAAALVKDVPEQEISDYNEMMGNNLFLSIKGKAKAKIENYQLIIQDNGTDLPVFSVGKLLTQRETKTLWNKNLFATVKITDKKNAFDYSLMQWSGDGEPVFPILTGYQNEQPIFAAGWTRVQNKFIPEDVVSGVHTDTNAFTVPADAKQVAMMIYPHDSAIPTVLQLNDFEIDIRPAFTESYIGKLTHESEHHLEYVDYAYKSVVAVPNGYSSYRYTVNDTPTKIPVGVFSGGDGKIYNDNAWSDAGSSDPNKTQGDAKFKADGNVKSLTYSVRIGNETATENDVILWWQKVGGSEVPNSRYIGKIAANSSVLKTIDGPEFSFDAVTGESYRLMAQSNIKDGFFIESKIRAYPLIEVIYDFDELTEREKQLAEKITAIDDELVITQAALDKDAYIQLDWDSKNDRPSLTAEVK